MQQVGRKPGTYEKNPTLGFIGFHSSFNVVLNHITLALRDEFPFAVVDIDKGEVPEYLFFSVFGQKHLAPHYNDCVKIFTCEENIRTPWEECDFAMTGDRLSMPDEQHLRMPIYARYLFHLRDHTGRTILKPADLDPKAILAKKTKFCNFVYSNPGAKERILFFRMLSKYKQVDAGGAVENNMGGRKVADKLAFLEAYKFTIAFENSRFPGYVTEKIVEPMVASSIPIYWGCRSIGLDFNPFSFVHANEPVGSRSSELEHHFEHVIRKIAWLDTHDDDYCKMMAEPWFAGNVPNQYCMPHDLINFMRMVFTYHKRGST
jgi:hypothetical protein